MPDLRLRVHRFDAAAKHEVDFDITSPVILESKPGTSRSFTMLATRLHLSWTWRNDEWCCGWGFHGHRYRKTTGDWSPHEQGYMSDWDIDLPDWVLPLIEANAPTAPPVVTIDGPSDDEPRCRICGCTENNPCEGGCQWVADPHGGHVCSTHFVRAEDLNAGDLVRSVEWADGDLVRIIAADPTPGGQIAVYYQDACVHRPGTLVHVAPDFPVLPEERDR